ncbi:hypothetical protein G9A89_018799 [Geosiphon pyriformis]|nr:hypothetical protein G9A89_018799 [Geosiphon pyriformis]
MEATQYQALVKNNWLFKTNALGLHPTKITECEPTIIASHATENSMTTQNNKTNRTTNYVSLVEKNYSMKECGTTFLVEEECVILYVSTQSLLVTG